MLKAGQTILLPKPGHSTPHLWVVLLAPDPVSNETVIVNLTSQKTHSDNTVVLNPGEHPFVQHPTVVFFADARIVDAKLVAAAMQAGAFQALDNCSDAMLLKIQQGLLASSLTPQKVKLFASRQPK